MKPEIEEVDQIQKIEESTENYKDAYKSKNPKFSKLGNWLKKQSTMFKNEDIIRYETKPSFIRGEIIKVNFGVNMGSELSDIHFAIVLNSDDNEYVDNITVLPLSSKDGYRRLFLGKLKVSNNINGNKGSYGLITQVTTISKTKIINRRNKFFCSKEKMALINDELIKYLTK